MKRGRMTMRDKRFFSYLQRCLLATLLCGCMLTTGMPATAFAEAEEPDDLVVVEESTPTEEQEELEEPEELEESVVLELEEPEEVVATEEAADSAELASEDLTADLPEAVTLDLAEDVSLDEPLDNDALLDAYVQQLLDAPLQGEEGQEDISLTAQTVPLQGIDATLYAQLRVLVSEVASGTRTNTAFEIKVTDLLEKTTWSAEDLGVESVVYRGDDGNLYFVDEALAAVRAIVDPHLKSVLVALVSDCPYDLYWLLNTHAMTMDSLTITATREGGVYYLTVATVEDETTGQDAEQYLHIGLRVAEGYRADPDNEFEVEPQKVVRANNAVINAQNVVNDTAGMATVDRLRAFMQRICTLVEYDHDAIDNDRPYGDPWQLINVFDGDTSTNVVCEGYSKAFKYLCDLASISNVSVTLVTGPMGGGTGAGTGHMWNIVNMPDGRNYLVDVTNCDAGTIGAPDLLFLAIPDAGVYNTQYVFYPQGVQLTYGYDQDTLAHYEPSELTLSSTAYDPSVVDPDLINLSGATVSVSADGLVYSGEEFRPAVSVVLDGTTLNENVDYTLTYGNNVNAGQARVTVRGIGNYTGSAAASFTIQHRPVTVYAGTLSKVYGESDPNLTEGAYAEGVIGTDTVNCTFSRVQGENVGTYVLEVTGEELQGNYQVTYQNGAFTINPCPLTEATIAPIADQPYTGSEITPEPVVTVNGTTLTKDTDYTLAYDHNVELGTATVTVTGQGNYRDSVSVSFQIVLVKDVADLTIAPIADQTYTGAAITPEPTVKDGEAVLAKGQDYTLTWKNNTNAGTATVTITGAGNYSGSRDVTFTINPKAISSAKVAAIANKAYTGGAIKPAPTVKDGSKTLKSGTDYKVAYKNNTKVGTATVTITGLGNYKGTKSVTFKIVAASVAKATVSKIANQRYDGKAKTPRPTVKVGTRTLKLNADYTLTYKSNVKPGTATVTIKGKGSYTGTKSVTFKIVAQKGTWTKVSGKWRYVWPDKAYPKSVFLDIDGKTYYFNASGYMLTGWQKIGAKYYYFESSGAMAKSKWVGNYYLQADGTMATNKWIGKYHVDANGKWDMTK